MPAKSWKRKRGQEIGIPSVLLSHLAPGKANMLTASLTGQTRCARNSFISFWIAQKIVPAQIMTEVFQKVIAELQSAWSWEGHNQRNALQWKPKWGGDVMSWYACMSKPSLVHVSKRLPAMGAYKNGYNSLCGLLSVCRTNVTGFDGGLPFRQIN